MTTLQLTDSQVKILLRLLESNIDHLVDEPPESPGGREARDCQEMFDQLT